MPDITQFGNLHAFPIASVIQAAQQNALLQERAREVNNQQLLEGINNIGVAGQTLVNKRQQIAQALALGKQFDIPDEVAKNMTPQQVLGVGTIKKGQIDMQMLMNLLHPGFAPNNGAPSPASASTPTSTATPSAEPSGATLTSDTTTTPLPAVSPSPVPSVPQAGGLPPPTTGSMPVPIPAPPATPKMVNPATFGAAFKLAATNRLEPVKTREQALAEGGVRHGTHILPDEKSNDKEQQKAETNFDRQLLMSIRSRTSALGIEDRKVNQAIHLRQLFNKHTDPKTGEINLPPTLYNDVSLGLATLASPTAQPGIELLRELRQRTAKGDIAGVAAYLGLTDANGNVPTGSTQNVLKMVRDNIDRQGLTSEELRNQEFDSFKQLAPLEARPEWVESRRKVRLGNSYSDFLSKSPGGNTSQGAGAAWDASKEQRYQELLNKRQKGSLKL